MVSTDGPCAKAVALVNFEHSAVPSWRTATRARSKNVKLDISCMEGRKQDAGVCRAEHADEQETPGWDRTQSPAQAAPGPHASRMKARAASREVGVSELVMLGVWISKVPRCAPKCSAVLIGR